MKPETRAIIRAYQSTGYRACTAKGGGFHIEGHGFRSLNDARRDTGVNMAKCRQPARRIQAWGDYAIVAMLNRIPTR